MAFPFLSHNDKTFALNMDKFQEEFSDYIESGFNPVLTQDGSLSLRQNTLGEDMHSSAGALKESLYIYAEPLRSFLRDQSVKNIEVLSVGLGLGYNEILAASLSIELGVEMKIVSFEKEAALIKLFKKRIKDPLKFPLFFKAFKSIGCDILGVCGFLHNYCEFKPSLDTNSLISLDAGSKAILFDAYSNKTSQALWSENFLVSLLEKTKAPSLLTTYASTGSLNRSLAKVDYVKIRKRSGFGFKRESTLAFKL